MGDWGKDREGIATIAAGAAALLHVLFTVVGWFRGEVDFAAASTAIQQDAGIIAAAASAFSIARGIAKHSSPG